MLADAPPVEDPFADSLAFMRAYEELLPLEADCSQKSFTKIETITVSEVKGQPDHPLYKLFAFGFDEVEIKGTVTEGFPTVEITACVSLGRLDGKFLKTPVDANFSFVVFSLGEGAERAAGVTLRAPESADYHIDLTEGPSISQEAWEELESVWLQFTAMLDIKYGHLAYNPNEYDGSDLEDDPEYVHLVWYDERHLDEVLGMINAESEDIAGLLKRGLISPGLLEKLTDLAEQEELPPYAAELFVPPSHHSSEDQSAFKTNPNQLMIW